MGNGAGLHAEPDSRTAFIIRLQFTSNSPLHICLPVCTVLLTHSGKCGIPPIVTLVTLASSNVFYSVALDFYIYIFILLCFIKIQVML